MLALGTKLEVIVARLALELQDKTDVIKGAPMVEPSDDLFWFNHPKFVLTLLHFTLFMVNFSILPQLSMFWNDFLTILKHVF